MITSLLKFFWFAFLLGACASSSRNTQAVTTNNLIDTTGVPQITADLQPQSLMELPQTQYGGFVLKPGFYEAEFKTYCLQPGTPDPSPGDAYLQGPVTGYRKDIIESVLLNSRENTGIEQKNVQLLLWSVVSGSNFNKLSPAVQADAMELLTPKQVFELRGGVAGVIKTVSNSTGILNANKNMQRLFETGISSYESYERLAVLRGPSQIRRTGVKFDQWYRQKEKYFIRYFPVSYKKVRIQVYVPAGLMNDDGKVNGEYIVFDPTGQQAIPAYTNAQRLGIGAPVEDIVREVIRINNHPRAPKKTPVKKTNTPVPGKELSNS